MAQQRWYVIDFHKKYYAIPVMLEAEGLKWLFGDDIEHHFYKYSQRRLFKKQKQADRVAAKLNKKRL